MAACDFNVCTLSAMAWMLARMRMNFLTKFLVRTRSFAMIFTASIWPLLAIFLMSTTSFFSWRSRLVRSRSSSRITCWLRTWRRRRWINTELKLDEEETVWGSSPHSQPLRMWRYGHGCSDLVECSLVLSEHLFWSLPPSKQCCQSHPESPF